MGSQLNMSQKCYTHICLGKEVYTIILYLLSFIFISVCAKPVKERNKNLQLRSATIQNSWGLSFLAPWGSSPWTSLSIQWNIQSKKMILLPWDLMFPMLWLTLTGDLLLASSFLLFPLGVGRSFCGAMSENDTNSLMYLNVCFQLVDCSGRITSVAFL